MSLWVRTISGAMYLVRSLNQHALSFKGKEAWSLHIAYKAIMTIILCLNVKEFVSTVMGEVHSWVRAVTNSSHRNPLKKFFQIDDRVQTVELNFLTLYNWNEQRAAVTLHCVVSFRNIFSRYLRQDSNHRKPSWKVISVGNMTHFSIIIAGIWYDILSLLDASFSHLIVITASAQLRQFIAINLEIAKR